MPRRNPAAAARRDGDGTLLIAGCHGARRRVAQCLRQPLQCGAGFPRVPGGADRPPVVLEPRWRALRDIGVRCECVRVPDTGHFDPTDAVALHETEGPTTVEGAVMRFVDVVVRG